MANAVGDTAVRSALTRGQLCGKTVIELGAGCGILGVTAAALGASNVFVTDLPECLELINNTVSDSQLGASTTAAVLDWYACQTTAALVFRFVGITPATTCPVSYRQFTIDCVHQE